MGDSGVIGSWEDVFGAAPAPLREIAEIAAGVIRAADPQAVETARPGDRAVTFGTGPRKMKDGYAYLMPQKAHVNLGFYRGAELADPARLLEGTGKALRHVKLRDAGTARGAGVAGLVQQAAALAREARP